VLGQTLRAKEKTSTSPPRSSRTMPGYPAAAPHPSGCNVPLTVAGSHSPGTSARMCSLGRPGASVP
jgi:hypothetical protein